MEFAFGVLLAICLAVQFARIADLAIAIRLSRRRMSALREAIASVERLERLRKIGAGPQRVLWAMNSLQAARIFLADEDATLTQIGMAERMLADLDMEPVEFWN